VAWESRLLLDVGSCKMKDSCTYIMHAEYEYEYK
jgi:hypothetical protein